MSGYAVRRIDEMESIHGGAVRLAGAELGVRSFGMQVLEFPAGFPDYPEHDHAEDGQEEVYVVLRGSARFEVGGETVGLEPGAMLYVEPGVSRRLVPGPDGVQFLAIGCVPGGSYERPDDFRLAAGR
jgi:mannose-6-phosphate isomerase-like protein (cupin superfamily)